MTTARRPPIDVYTIVTAASNAHMTGVAAGLNPRRGINTLLEAAYTITDIHSNRNDKKNNAPRLRTVGPSFTSKIS